MQTSAGLPCFHPLYSTSSVSQLTNTSKPKMDLFLLLLGNDQLITWHNWQTLYSLDEFICVHTRDSWDQPDLGKPVSVDATGMHMRVCSTEITKQNSDFEVHLGSVSLNVTSFVDKSWLTTVSNNKTPHIQIKVDISHSIKCLLLYYRFLNALSSYSDSLFDTDTNNSQKFPLCCTDITFLFFGEDPAQWCSAGSPGCLHREIPNVHALTGWLGCTSSRQLSF